MRLLVDETIGRLLVLLLRAAGHDLLLVSEMVRFSKPRKPGQPGSNGHVRRAPRDEAVLRHARADDRILVTNDGDYGALVFARGLRTPVGAIVFASRDLSAEEQADRIQAVIEAGGTLEGMHTVISRRTIRQRPLR
jgi:predicted nuclease of predicted toxin-antitoxin system